MPHASFPIRRIGRVHHIGTLKRTDKGERGSSLEGHGLSVSPVPEAWQRIAKLGGLPWWTLTNPQGRFLDMHRLSKSRRSELRAWGVGNEYAEETDGWSVTWFDDELGRDCRMFFLDPEQAQAEAECRGISPKTIRLLTASERLARRMGFVPDPSLVPEFVALCFAEEILRLDGAWWNDVLDPAGMSAPRGVIFPERMRFWDVQSYADDWKMAASA